MVVIGLIQVHLDLGCWGVYEWKLSCSVSTESLWCGRRISYSRWNDSSEMKYARSVVRAIRTWTIARECMHCKDTCTHTNSHTHTHKVRHTLGFSRKLWLLAKCHCPPAGPHILTGSLSFLHTHSCVCVTVREGERGAETLQATHLDSH